MKGDYCKTKILVTYGEYYFRNWEKGSQICSLCIAFRNFFIVLGVFCVFFAGQRYGMNFSLDYGTYSLQVPIFFPIMVLVSAGVILYFVSKMMLVLDKLLINLQNDIYFIPENIKFLSKTFRYLLLSTGIELFINIIFNFFSIENTSGLFDLSVKDYLVNFAFIVINAVGLLVLKRGYQVQKDYDEII